MSRIGPVIRREFTQAATSRGFIIGTLVGPLLIAGIFAAQFLIIAKSGGGEQRIAIVDATGRDLAPRVIREVEQRASRAPSFVSRAAYTFDTRAATDGERESLGAELSSRIMEKELDGYLWIPGDALEAGAVAYEGSNATNSQVTGDLRQAVQRVIQSERLRQEGIDEARLAGALTPVTMDISKTGESGSAGNPRAATLLAFAMAFAIYLVVVLYGQSIMTSVQEEKRDRIVELIVSSVRARDLLVGKVLGIGAAGVLQMVIWVAAAAVLLTHGATIAGWFGASEGVITALSQQSFIPRVPLSVGVAFILYFAGGFFLFATLFAVVGAIVTSPQEAQQIVFPIVMPFVLGLFIAMPAAENPGSGVAIAGSLIPLTSPMVMPVRVSVAGIDWIQLGLSLLLLYATAGLIIWLAAKIYRVAIFATGKKPTGRELIRWMRAA